MTKALLLALALCAPAAALEVPDLDSRVIDRAGLMKESTRLSLVVKLRDFEKATGHQVAVLTLNSLEGEPLEAYALKVARTWGLGRAGVNDGVLFLIVSGDRKMRIEVGHGLEGTLPDALAGRIINDVVAPRFRAGDMSGGVVAGSVAILDALGGNYKPAPSWERRRPASALFPMALLFVVLFPFFLLRAARILSDGDWSSGGGSDWGSSSSDSSSSSGSSDSFSGGGGSFGGGGASGSW